MDAITRVDMQQQCSPMPNYFETHSFASLVFHSYAHIGCARQLESAETSSARQIEFAEANVFSSVPFEGRIINTSIELSEMLQFDHLTGSNIV